ncbi:hypothetical protein BYZ73_12655 [Rhodovulum viride]|uniref:Hedgehog/Intein (Hint) domain-containing protein n=1 Tax=Rhodovulum viride TaxID=1231134 RepID=A0ABX9DFA8_9RHOB|nr:Hint domain-containing protein [Rhodovulum viride]RAP41040.1 hypothetical protein BYZ73_12655 [Rhodovulum viride]
MQDFNPDIDYLYLGDMSPDDLVFTATADPKIWEVTIAGGDPADKMELDWTYHWSDITAADLRARALGSGTYTAPEDLSVAYFTAGSRIATPEGPQPLTELRPGDLVLTLDRGPCPVRDVLTTDLDPATLARHPELRPVVLEPSALGPGRPDRRMHPSPQHGVLMLADGREVLVRPPSGRRTGPGPYPEPAPQLAALYPPSDGPPCPGAGRWRLERELPCRSRDAADARPRAQARGKGTGRALLGAGPAASAPGRSAPRRCRDPLRPI